MFLEDETSVCIPSAQGTSQRQTRHCDRDKCGGTHSLISFRVKNARSAGVASLMGASRSRKAGSGIGPSQVATAYSSLSLRLRDCSMVLHGRQINCPVGYRDKQDKITS